LNLPRVAQAFPGSSYGAGNQCALWRGDITTLRVDAIVNAANAKMLGCFQPFHTCIDNAIHSAAGPRLREDCHAIMQRQGCPEGTGWAKLTRAYNLPARYILHTVGPIVVKGENRVLPEHEQQLSDCYHSCLELAKRVSAIRSIAFCCISTGVFGFPQGLAARIALQTVEGWLSGNPNSLDLAVFNVFGEDDFEIYERLLKGT
jgi:O-acetyl-ADP-ribose deacetylase (regulator of RNase III)